MYKLVKRQTYIEEYEGTKLVNVWKVIKKHLCKLDSRDGYNFKLCYCVNFRTREEKLFKVTYLDYDTYEIDVCDKDTENEFGILCKPR